MKTICHALFALSALLIASCSKQTSDIIEWSTNGVTGVRMPLHVTFVENVQVEESAMQDAISITPAVGFDAYLSGMRMIRIVPKSPLQYDTQYKVAIDAAKLTGRQHKGIAEFRFATPKLRFTYNDSWLQQNDEMTGYVLIGEIVSSDYAEGSYMERNLKISGAAGTDVKWTHSEDGLTHQYTVGNIVPRGDEGYTLTLDFNYDEKQTLQVEVPRKDEYAVIDHSVNPDPLAIVVTFSEPIRQNQDLKNLIRFDTKFRTSVDKNRLYIYPEARPTGAHSVTIGRDVVSKNGQKLKESYSFTITLPSRTPSIRFTGNRLFDADELLDQMQLGMPNWFSWYTKRDLYSREKLAADLETIRSFYMNQGYLDFKIDSVQVSIAPNKSDVYITINMTEGEKYTIASAKLTGDLLGIDEELNKLLTLKAGEIYSAEQVNNVSTALVDKLSTLGYAFATATPNPIADRENRTVEVVYTIDPGRRAYVRRVNITGNNRTKDEVIRREVRQYESAWFDSSKVKLSRDRIDRLGYFESVTADPVPVPGTRDQVDVDIKVKERPTGSVSLGAGYSTSDGIILSAGFAQNNVFGTGKSVSVDVNTSKSQRTYALSVVEPYITPEGISRSWEVYDRRVDLEELDVADVEYETRGASLAFGIPFTENDRVFLGGKIESTKVDANSNSPQRYQDYVNRYGADPVSVAATVGWSRDSRDNSLAPTRGVYQRLNGEVGLPGMDIEYYKFTYQYQHYFPLSRTWTLAFNGEVGYGDVYGQTDMFPFFKNFYVGGIGSVRGFESGTLGPKDSTNKMNDDADNLGGDRMVNASLELLAPLPGGDRTLRIFGFLDAGYAWGYEGFVNANGHADYRRQEFSMSDLRYSTGIGVAWISPLGPLKFSLAFPLNEKEGDKTQRFQFQIGTGF